MPFGRRRIPKMKKPKKPTKPRAPKLPKQARAPRPKSKDLRMIYKGMLTTSVQNRIATLAYGLQWYDGAIPYVIQRGGLKNPDVQKKLETAVKCRKQAMGTSVDHEKESAFLMALRCYEKACVMLAPPVVDDALAEYNAKKVVLQEKQAKLEQRFGFIVTMLQKAIGDRVKLEVADAVKPMQYNPALTTLSYNREAARALADQYRAEGFMPVLFGQLEFLAQHASLTPDGNGGYQYSAEDQLKITNELLKEFLKFSKSADAPKRLIKSGQLLPQAPRAALGTATPRPPRQSSKGPKVAGHYQPGCNLAMLWLVASDQQEHSWAEELGKLSAINPQGIRKSLVKDGPKFGEWTVEENGDKFRMVLAQPQAQVV